MVVGLEVTKPGVEGVEGPERLGEAVRRGPEEVVTERPKEIVVEGLGKAITERRGKVVVGRLGETLAKIGETVFLLLLAYL